MTEQVVKALSLRLPQQEKKEPAVGSTNPRRLRRWLDELPPMNVLENARQLFRYLHDLNRCHMRSRARYELLEILRPHVFYVCDALEKDFLGHNLVLPDRPKQSASLAQALQTYLADGYLIMVRRALAHIDEPSVKKALPTLAHRAMVSLRDTLLRTQLLYFRPPRYLWLTLHQLYVAAEQHQMLDRNVVDKLVPQASSSVAAAYSAALLHGVMGANQLRQSELKRVSPLMVKLASLANISVRVPEERFFYINLSADRAPMARKFLGEQRGRFRYLVTNKLLAELAHEAAQQKIPNNIVEHLFENLSGERERALERQPKKIPLEICFGLSATHYYLSDGADFQSSRSVKEVANLVGEETNVFLKGKPKPKDKDAWTISFDSSEELRNMDTSGLSAAVSAYSRQQRPRNTEPRYKKYQCETIDVSAGGYGVAWEKQVPEQLKTGELVAVREQLSLGWTIGVVRWVRQQSHGGAEFGIEYLASQAWPAAVRNLNFSESEHVRAIVLPELLIQGFETSLLLPSVGFKLGDEVEVVHQGVTETFYLHKVLLRAAGFMRYELAQQRGESSDKITEKSTANAELDVLDSIF